jgi:hypothetical protein
MTPRTSIKHRREGDRLLTPDGPPVLAACDYAVAPFDRAALDADRTWGQNRLPELVSPETAARYGSAIGKLNAAIRENDEAEVIARVHVCIRGLAAMDQEARQRGHKPLRPTYWQGEVNGRRCAIVREPGDWPVVARELPGVSIYTLDEALHALEYRLPPLDNGQPAPPRRTAIAEDLNDALPF